MLLTDEEITHHLEQFNTRQAAHDSGAEILEVEKIDKSYLYVIQYRVRGKRRELARLRVDAGGVELRKVPRELNEPPSEDEGPTSLSSPNEMELMALALMKAANRLRQHWPFEW